MTLPNLILFCVSLVAGTTLLYLSYCIIKEVDAWQVSFLTIPFACGFLFGAYVAFNQPRYGDRRVACVQELKRMTFEEHGVKYSRVDFFCSGKYREEIYVKRNSDGEWAEVEK